MLITPGRQKVKVKQHPLISSHGYPFNGPKEEEETPLFIQENPVRDKAYSDINRPES